MKINTVCSFKMNSGEEIIGKVIEIFDTHFVVANPLSTAPTQQGLQLMPALFSIELENTVEVYRNSISIIGSPRTDVLDAYLESTTGIKVPEKKIILG